MRDLAPVFDQIGSGTTLASLESDTLDFKAPRDGSTASMKLIAEATVCFANANGGTIVVGVADQTVGAAAFVGTEIDDLDLRRYIYTNTSGRPRQGSTP